MTNLLYLAYIINTYTERKMHMIENQFQDNAKKAKLGVVGLGYVGLPVAIGFSRKYQVIGFDIDKNKIRNLQNNLDPQGQFSSSEIKTASIQFVSDEEMLKGCSYIIVAVPTPITSTKQPDLKYLKNATQTIGKHLSKQTTVIYESTVYPSTTETICIPILEKYSGLRAGNDFYVGYSPERINPGDEKRTFSSNAKIVSGQDQVSLEKIYHLYRDVIQAPIHKAPSIEVAEASKIVENIQRDVNIALMNELSLIFDKLNIDTHDVINAAKTKWNFIPFTPGLVGGHCIGVDPYFLIHQSRYKGYEPSFLFAAREINESMPHFVVQSLLNLIVSQKLHPKDLTVTILGITFKENVPDVRNSKSLEIINQLNQLGISTQVCDPYADFIKLNTTHVEKLSDLKQSDVVILAVPHREFIKGDMTYIKDLLKSDTGIIMDLKGIISKKEFKREITIWSL